MIDFLKKDDLSVGSLGVGGVLEGIEDLLEGQSLSSLSVSDFPDNSIGSTTYLLDDFIFLEYMWFYFF